MPWAGNRMEDDPQQSLMPETSPQRTTKWIHWHAQQLDMPAWWQELQEVPRQEDIQEFAKKVWASFEVPKVRCCTSKVENDYSALSAPHSLDRDQFLHPQDMRFGSQDYQLIQIKRPWALQHWVEKAQPLTPGKSHQLVEIVAGATMYYGAPDHLH